MAELVETFLVDDLTGERTDDGETITFGIDGQQYEIDLDPDNAGRLREALATYVAHARKLTVGRKPRRSKASSPTGDKSRTQAIREWARERGIKVSDRGRIAADVIAAYEGNPGPVYPNLSKDNAERLGMDEPLPQVQEGEPVLTGRQKPRLSAVPEPDDSLTASDDKIVAWMQSKGFKIPASGKPSAPMRARYKKEALGQTG